MSKAHKYNVESIREWALFEDNTVFARKVVLDLLSEIDRLNAAALASCDAEEQEWNRVRKLQEENAKLSARIAKLREALERIKTDCPSIKDDMIIAEMGFVNFAKFTSMRALEMDAI